MTGTTGSKFLPSEGKNLVLKRKNPQGLSRVTRWLFQKGKKRRDELRKTNFSKKPQVSAEEGIFSINVEFNVKTHKQQCNILKREKWYNHSTNLVSTTPRIKSLPRLVGKMRKS